jgi:hypothetical protein
MAMPDDESMFEYYADPDNRVAAGPGRRRATKPLTTHVPIRFNPEVIAEVKQLAETDRKSVSTWIRDVVEAEIERRQPRIPESVGNEVTPDVHWTTNLGVAIGQSSTVPDARLASAS